MKMSSMGASTALEMSTASLRDGSYRAFSRRMIVSRRTPTWTASCSWVSSFISRYRFDLHSKSGTLRLSPSDPLRWAPMGTPKRRQAREKGPPDHVRGPSRKFSQYIPMSGAGAAAGAGGSGLSATRDSVVSSTEATELAFSSAERVTLVGSTMPEAIMSQYSSL